MTINSSTSTLENSIGSTTTKNKDKSKIKNSFEIKNELYNYYVRDQYPNPNLVEKCINPK